MTKEQAIKLAGSGAILARLLGITSAAITQWKTIPKQRLYQLQVIKPEWFNTKTESGCKPMLAPVSEISL
jgi:hypothetical protein